MSGLGRAALALAGAALLALLVAVGAPSADAASEHIGISLPFSYSPGNTAAAGPPSTTWSISNIGTVDATVEVHNSTVGLAATLTVPAMTTALYTYVSPYGDNSFPGGRLHTPLFVHWFTSTSDDIVVSQFAAIRGRSAVAEASTLLPTSALGYSHFLAHYEEKGANTLSVVATADGATVTLTPAANIDYGVYRSGFSFSPADPTFPAMAKDVPTTFTLGPYESRRLDAMGDVTGSILESDHPVAVFGSSLCAKAGASQCNHLEDPTLPAHHLGTEYVGCAAGGSFNSYRVVATKPGLTDVTIDPVPVSPSMFRGSSPPASGYYATGKGFTITPTGVQLSGVGSWYQFDLGTNMHLNATQDVAVSVVAAEQTATVLGDPAILVPRPTTRWAPQLDFWVPDHDWTGRAVYVVGPAGAVANMDGVPFSLGSPVGSSGYACQMLSVTPGQHRIVSDSNVFASIMVESSNENRMWYSASGSFPPVPVADFAPTTGSAPTGPRGPYTPPGWDPTVACARKARSFNDFSTPGVGALDKSLWEWGDSLTTTYDPWSATASHVFALPGTYTVKLTVWDDAGARDSVSKPVRVIECDVPPVAVIRLGGGGADCVDNRVHFFADLSYDPDGGAPLTFTWDFGDGDGADGNPAIHQFATSDPVTVTLTAYDDDGRSTAATVEYPAPGDPNCVPDLATLKDIYTTPGQSIAIPLAATDSDGPTLDVRVVVGKPDGALVTSPGINFATGSYTFVTQGWDTGVHTLTFEAFDGFAYDRESMRVNVRGLDSDVDRDGVQDAADNCPGTPNLDQADLDQDGVGDACEDTVPYVADQPFVPRPGTGGRDTDRDGIQDLADNCVFDANASQEDLDRDGAGDACDADMDGDTVADKGAALYLDNCPTVPNPDQLDSDAAGAGDACAGLLAGDRSRLAPRPAAALSADSGGGSSAWGWVAAAVAVAGLAWLFRWRKRLVPALLYQFSRLTGRDALDHPVRAQISALVFALPGIHQRELARRAGRSRRVVTYHLGVLLGHGVLQSSEVQGYTCYYPKGYPRAQLAESRVLRAPLAQQILERVQQHPGQDATSMARALGVSSKGLHYHIRRMEKAGLVRGERRGLVKQIYPAAASA
ncbi:MAG: hypothetical protein QOD77_868 [Thermoplasmata archaeon]|jgi:PKD repeat protein/DNA-binding transcriptional ArsR family regulator|nr:hypothetical protein [Thermoplasmata archaeon]